MEEASGGSLPSYAMRVRAYRQGYDAVMAEAFDSLVLKTSHTRTDSNSDHLGSYVLVRILSRPPLCSWPHTA